MMASEKTALRELTEKLKQEGFADIRFYIAKTRKFGLNVLDGEKENRFVPVKVFILWKLARMEKDVVPSLISWTVQKML